MSDWRCQGCKFARIYNDDDDHDWVAVGGPSRGQERHHMQYLLNDVRMHMLLSSCIIYRPYMVGMYMLICALRDSCMLVIMIINLSEGFRFVCLYKPSFSPD